MNNKQFNLPKPYISYSAFSLWQKDKGAFRRRYYLGEKSFETTETIFGKTIAEALEDGHKIPGIVHYEESEYRIEVELVPGLKLLGYLDGFNPSNNSIVELKTGHLSPDGKAPWDKVKVRKHKQLVFYTLLVKLKYGKVHQWTTLQWLETEFKNKTMEFQGHVLESKSRELELTGKVLTFKRRIAQWERDVLVAEIISAANEISEDYTTWLKETQLSPQ
jgi:hypothetical protein